LVNHAFQDNALAQWSAVNGAQLAFVNGNGISSQIPYSASIAPGGTGIGIQNPGWAGGIGVQAVKYDSFFYAKADSAVTLPIKAGIYNSNTEIASNTINAGLTTQWQRFATSFTSTQTSNGGSNYKITLPNGSSTKVYIAYASLTAPFWNGQPLRSDIAQAYADLKPAYVRTPGGNDVEGNNQASRYRW
jgi:alpha-L-arabinofuranosidase